MTTLAMKTTGKGIPKASTADSDYERLLSAAQAAQAAADRAVAGLASIKRTLAEAPRVTQLRRDELAKAQQALERAETELAQAREIVGGKQAEAARLIEAAADAQRLLAQALIKQDVMPDGAGMPALSDRLAAAQPKTQQSSPGASPSFTATLGTNRYTPTLSMHPADLHSEVVEYLRDRDALCPSCGHSLRGLESARCPSCKLQLSVPVLKNVRAHPLAATKSIWIVRGLALFAMVMSAYLAFVVFRRSRPFGCGVGSLCDYAIKHGWSRLLGIPVALFGVPVYFGILASTGFINIGLTDHTRRKAWLAMSGLSILAGITGLWLIVVQFALVKAVCPHCLLVDLAGVAIAALVLARAPLGRPESLPERAAGPIVIPRSNAASLTGAAAILVVVLGLGQAFTAGRQPHMDRDQFTGQNKPKEEEDGLLMKGLDLNPQPEKPAPQKQPQTPATPGTPTKEDDAPATNDGTSGLLLPGLDLRAKTKTDWPLTKLQGGILDDSNDATEKKEPVPVKKNELLDDANDANAKKPASEPTIDFSETLPLKKRGEK